jgi:hypothetical protein
VKAGARFALKPMRSTKPTIYQKMYKFKMQCSYILAKSGKIAGTFNLAYHLKNVSAKVKQNIQTMSL